MNKLEDNKINVEITYQVTFMKSTYMKFIIERSTNVEMIKWLEVFFAHLKAVSFLFFPLVFVMDCLMQCWVIIMIIENRQVSY